VRCAKPGKPGVPEPGNEKARKGTEADTGNQDTDLGNSKRRRPAPMLTGEGMPDFPGQTRVHAPHLFCRLVCALRLTSPGNRWIIAFDPGTRRRGADGKAGHPRR
jgi:hypothetical protein